MVSYYISFVTLVAGLLLVFGYATIEPTIVFYFVGGIIAGLLGRVLGLRENILLCLSWLSIVLLPFVPLSLKPILLCATFLGAGSTISIIRWRESLREYSGRLITFFRERPFLLGISFLLAALYFGELLAPILATTLFLLLRRIYGNQRTVRVLGILGVLSLLVTGAFYLAQTILFEPQYALTHWLIQRSLIGWTASLFAVCFMFSRENSDQDGE